jgi:ABC-type Fe3+-hydroxamate transport system substrate-binding protein
MVALRISAQTLAHLRSDGGGLFRMRRWAHRTHLAVFGVVLVACRATDRPPHSVQGLAITDDAGRTVRLTRPARRIASLLPSFTEILFAIGAGDRIVGRTAWCDYPPAARAIPNLGDGIPPNVEAVADRQPDLVVLYHAGPNTAASEQLERLGITTVLFDMNRLEDLSAAARRLGILTARQAAAESLAGTLQRLASDSAASSPATHSLAYIVWDNPPIVIGAGSYLDRLATLAGARNVFHDVATPSAQVSIETIAARDPDFLAVLTDSTEPPAFVRRPRPEWRVLRGVRLRHFLILPGTLFGRPSPRAALAVEQLRRMLDSTR